MKQTLLFLQKYYWQFVGVFAAFAVILMGGAWLTRGQENGNLFYIYLGVYPFFFIIFPMIFGMSMRYYLELCISFGAIRKHVFVVLQLLSHALWLTFLLVCLGLEVSANALLPADKLNALGSLLSAENLPLSCLLSLALLQGGICIGRMKQTKLLGVVMGVCLALFGCFVGAGAAMSNDVYIPFLDPANPWYAGVCLALVLAMVGLLVLARRLYRKAAVTV